MISPYKNSLVTIKAIRSKKPGIQILGLPDAAVKEAAARLGAALAPWLSTGNGRGCIVSLEPSGLRKRGAGFDLPIALAVLAANGAIEDTNGHMAAAGEVSLDGSLAPVFNAVMLAETARANGVKALLLPMASARAAAVVEGIEIRGADTLEAAIAGGAVVPPHESDTNPYANSDVDFSEVKGQEFAKQSIALAVAGGHHVLMSGVMGAGKTMLARRIPTIMPPLSRAQKVELTRIYQLSDKLTLEGQLIDRPPFRAPHHTASAEAVMGGGRSTPTPGEVSLAHGGVLFLDEFGELRHNLLEGLREALETGSITISRAEGRETYPCGFMLVGAMNPCLCGREPCNCTPAMLARYSSSLSGPVLDRIDVHLYISPSTTRDVMGEEGGMSSADLRAKVALARAVQFARQGPRLNSALSRAELVAQLDLSDGQRAALADCADRLALTERGYDKLLRLGRTLADCEGAERITYEHLIRALPLRASSRMALAQANALAAAVTAAGRIK